jgi:hypothetical protein
MGCYNIHFEWDLDDIYCQFYEMYLVNVTIAVFA